MDPVHAATRASWRAQVMSMAWARSELVGRPGRSCGTVTIGAMVSTVPPDVVLARLHEADRELLLRFRAELSSLLGPRLRDLRLYGSKARGDDHEESDIDVLVLIDQKDSATWTEIIELASRITATASISPRVIEFDDYHSPPSRATGFYKELRKDSVKLL